MKDETRETVTEEQKQACKDTVDKIVAYFGGNQQALQVLGYKSRQTFHVWVKNGGIPADAAWKIQGLSNGDFLAVEISEEAATQLEIRKAQIHMSNLVQSIAS